MAITIEQSPIGITPAYEDIIYVISSTNSGNVNFKYVVDVVIKGQSHRLTLFPHPSFGTAYVNIGKIVETYLSSDIDLDLYGFQEAGNSFVDFSVQFGEQYGNPVSVFPNLTSTTQTAWNGIVDFLPFTKIDDPVFLLTEYIMNTTFFATKYLTNSPSNLSIGDDENAFLYGMTDTSGVIGMAKVTTKDTAGSTIQTVLIQNPYIDSDVFDSKVVGFGCGTKNLNLIDSSRITLGAQPIITDSVASYEVRFAELDASVVSLVKTYTISNPCTRNTLYRLHFLNKTGGFDSYTFNRADTKRVSINRSSYKKNAASLTASDSYGYTARARTNIAYNTTQKDNISVLSDWITEEESTWLEELISSPEVYLEDATYGLVSINVSNSSYDFKQVATEKLFNLRISFTYSYDRFRQRY